MSTDGQNPNKKLKINSTSLPPTIDASEAAKLEKQRRKQEKKLLKQQQNASLNGTASQTAMACSPEEERKQDKLRRKEEKLRQQQQLNGSTPTPNGQLANGSEQTEEEKTAEKKRRKQAKRAAAAAAAAVVATPAPVAVDMQAEEQKRREEKRKRKQEKREREAAAANDTHTNGANGTTSNGDGSVNAKAALKAAKKQQKMQNGAMNGDNNHTNGNSTNESKSACTIVVEKKKHSVNNSSSSDSFYNEHPEIASMTSDAVDAYRKELNVTVCTEQDAWIRPIKSFSQAGFPDCVERCVAKFERPTAIQAQCWPAALRGRDVIGIAKTGSGKTLGFMLPAYVKILDLISRGAAPAGPLCLVLAPTRELAMQSANVCNAMESETQIKTVCIYGGVDSFDQVNALKQGARVVIATPGRLIGLVQDGRCKLNNVSYAVLDEADRMLDLGFEPDVRTIMGQVNPSRQTLLFSATWPTTVQKLGSEFVTNPFHVLVGSEQLTANHDVAQIVEVTDETPGPKDKRLLEIMKQYYNKQLKNRILVFVLYKKDVPRVEKLLQDRGYACGSISSDHTQANRIKALEAFRDGSRPVLVGTDVASRGLDIPDVSHVINYSFPLTIEDYIHRIGRTGRSGKKGVSHTFFSKFDKGLAGQLVNVLNEASAEVPEDLLKFGTGVKRKEHSMYGLHYKAAGNTPMPGSKRVVFT